MARAEDKAFAQQIRAFLDVTPFPELSGKAAFRHKCLEELQAARKGQALTAGTLDPGQLAQGTADFARFSDPQSLLDAEWRMVIGLAGQVKEAGFPNLAWLLSQRPRQGTPILVAGVRYFFRRAVEEDQKLFQGLSFARLEAMGEAQEKGFACLSAALNQQGRRLEELLGDVKAVVVQTHSAVLDMQAELLRLGSLHQTGGAEVRRLLEEVLRRVRQVGMQQGEVKPQHSLSIRSEDERQAVKQLLARFRKLPADQQQQLPALLYGLGKLQIGTGDFEGAKHSFVAVAMTVNDASAQAEAHYNAYRAALEEKKWDEALTAIQQAVSLDGQRFALFPMQRYQPKRILGAGGFGTAFLCHDCYSEGEVVVKVLHATDLERNMADVFREAKLLHVFIDEAVIGVRYCDYANPVKKDRPYIVMDYFPGGSLENFVHQRGTLSAADLLVVARQVAQGMRAAHQQGVLHRDLKPANVLVRKEGKNWKVKIIDFGLGLRKLTAETTLAGTFEYAPPEQKRELRGVKQGPHSDVFAFGKTCCFALFKTTEPKRRQWSTVPGELAEMLERCTEEDLEQRYADFDPVLQVLKMPHLIDAAELQAQQEEERRRGELARLREEGETKLSRFRLGRDIVC